MRGDRDTPTMRHDQGTRTHGHTGTWPLGHIQHRVRDPSVDCDANKRSVLNDQEMKVRHDRSASMIVTLTTNSDNRWRAGYADGNHDSKTGKWWSEHESTYVEQNAGRNNRERLIYIRRNGHESELDHESTVELTASSFAARKSTFVCGN